MLMMENEMPLFSPAMELHVRNAEHAWNTGDLDALVLSNTIDCLWRNRVNFLWGREQIRAFLVRQARRQLEPKVIFELWAETEAHLAVRFAAEFHDDSGTWYRAYGCEEIEFDSMGLAKRRLTTANEHPIRERERILRWPAGPRPPEHPTLSELGF